MSFTGGKLKLKGSGGPGIGKKKRKKYTGGDELALTDSKAEDGDGGDSGVDGKVNAARNQHDIHHA